MGLFRKKKKNKDEEERKQETTPEPARVQQPPPKRPPPPPQQRSSSQQQVSQQQYERQQVNPVKQQQRSAAPPQLKQPTNPSQGNNLSEVDPSPPPNQQDVRVERADAPKGELKTPPPPPLGFGSNSDMSSASAPASELEEQNERNHITRELVKKFVADIWNRGELELIPEVCSKSIRFNGSVGMDRVGHEGFARMVKTIREALADYHCEIHSMVVEGGKAFCRVRFTGRHTGSLLGYAPTGRQVAWMGAAEFTCKASKIIKVWELGDVKSLEDQLSGS